MPNEMVVLITRAKRILQTDGLATLIKRGITRGFYEHQILYLYEHELKDRDESDYKPRIADFIFKIITTTQEVDHLISSGYNFQLDLTDARNRVKKGAVAFCILVGKELASIGFIALTQEAMDSLNQPPYKVSFSRREACTGGGWTNPCYRAFGLATYVYYKRLQALKDMGKVIARAAVLKNNIASQKMHARFTTRIRAEGHSYRILWHIFWREKPVTKPLDIHPH